MTKKLVLLLVLAVVAFFFFLPFFWMLLTSIKPKQEIFMYPPTFIPSYISIDAYRQLMTEIPYATFVRNSFILVTINCIGAILSSVFAAYAFARFRFRGRDVMFTIVLAAMVVPVYVIIVPLYTVMGKLGWLDTYLPLTVPTFFCYALGIFLLRQFFLTIPRELSDAAIIDGCSHLGILWRIYIPLSKPALITIIIFMAVFQWNDLLRPLVFLSSLSKMPISVGLVLIQGQYIVDWELLMGAALLSVIPMLVVFIALQKYYIQGIVTTGLKR